MVPHEILRPLPWGRGNPELWQLKYEVNDDRFQQMFDDYARMIRRSEKACDEAARQGNEEYLDFVGESEGEYLEEVIGASFLVLQAKIRRVTGAAIRLRKGVQTRHGVDIPEFASAASVRALGGRFKGKRASLVELLWDVGNYHKHRDEWPWEVWRNTRPGQRDDNKLARATRRSVQRVGIVQFSTGNMRTAYEFFGVDPYSSCAKLAQSVQNWAELVYKTAESRLAVFVSTQPLSPTRPTAADKEAA